MTATSVARDDHGFDGDGGQGNKRDQRDPEPDANEKRAAARSDESAHVSRTPHGYAGTPMGNCPGSLADRCRQR